MFLRCLTCFLLCGLVFFTGCKPKADAPKSDPLAERKLQLLVEENGRLCAAVTEVAKEVPVATAPDATKSVEANLASLGEANDKLRALVLEQQKAQKLTANVGTREDIERQVEEIRGLKFKEKVSYNVLGKKDIKAVLIKKLSAIFSEEEFEQASWALGRIGLLPEKYPLREKYIALLGEQVAAFYDQHEHKLFMFEESSLDNAQNQVILAHELTHAMQDQHFTLKRLPLEEKNNDDRSIGAAALVEGEATLVMTWFMMQNASVKMVTDSLATTFMQNMDEIAKAPRYLRELLLFPYMQGQIFCTELQMRGGYDAISAAYANPPSSSSQILHPEKYLREPREEPISVKWAEAKFEDKFPGCDNVVGELGVKILFADWIDDNVAIKASEGWRGDRYLSFHDGDALVWRTIWEDTADAAEFFEAEKALLIRRYKPVAPQSSDRRWEATAPRALRVILTEAHEVIIIDAENAEVAKGLEEKFGGS